MPVSKKRKSRRNPAGESSSTANLRSVPPPVSQLQGMPDDRRALEAVTADFARMMSGAPRDERCDRAQDLIYQAWESPASDRGVLVREAIEIDPDCADAYTILAEACASAVEAIPFYRRGVEAGQRTLGPDPFTDDVGHFWGLFGTRPYMRARAGLAEALWASGDREEALTHFLELLRLNDSDNQGIRYVVLPRLLEQGRDDQARELLERFEDDATAQWAWMLALITFRQEGASARAELELQRACKVNPAVEDYLTGHKPIPKVLPNAVGFGDESEAMVCAAEQIQAWCSTPAAVAWLDRHTTSS